MGCDVNGVGEATNSDKLNRRDRKQVERASAYGQEANLQI